MLGLRISAASNLSPMQRSLGPARHDPLIQSSSNVDPFTNGPSITLDRMHSMRSIQSQSPRQTADDGNNNNNDDPMATNLISGEQSQSPPDLTQMDLESQQQEEQEQDKDAQGLKSNHINGNNQRLIIIAVLLLCCLIIGGTFYTINNSIDDNQNQNDESWIEQVDKGQAPGEEAGGISTNNPSGLPQMASSSPSDVPESLLTDVPLSTHSPRQESPNSKGTISPSTTSKSSLPPREQKSQTNLPSNIPKQVTSLPISHHLQSDAPSIFTKSPNQQTQTKGPTNTLKPYSSGSSSNAPNPPLSQSPIKSKQMTSNSPVKSSLSPHSAHSQKIPSGSPDLPTSQTPIKPKMTSKSPVKSSLSPQRILTNSPLSLSKSPNKIPTGSPQSESPSSAPESSYIACQKPLPGTTYIGNGYDIFHGNPHTIRADPGFRQSIFDITKCDDGL